MVKLPFRLILFCLAVLLKFGLIWETEITDARDDSHEYVLQILHPVNGGLSYPPGTGIAARMFYDLGIPYRLGLEAAFLLAATLVLRSLFTWPWKSPLALGLFLLIIFDPALAGLFSHLYSDEVCLVETLLGLACLVLAFRREGRLDRVSVIAAVFFFGLSTLTRSVAIPLLAAVLLFTLLALLLTLTKYRSKKLKRNLDSLAFTVPVLIFGLCLIYGLACRYNFLRHGYSGLSYIDSREYKDFYLCLQSVGEPTGDRYFPIDENRRKLIARAGPDSQWFIRQLEQNTVYKQAGLEHYGKNDIPSGWFHWAAFTATVHNGDYMAAFALFRSIEKEIADAAKNGIIKIRPVASLPDARIPIVLAAYPDGLRAAIAQIIHEPAPGAFAAAQPTYDDPDFTRALTRRTVHESPLRESIWANLAAVYSWIYTPATFGLYIVIKLIFSALLLYRWKRIEEFPPLFLAQQMAALLFLILLFWYALFDASGMPVIARYMILNHILLPLLIAYYLTATLRLHRHNIL